jgi:hypothetical protein
VIPNDIKERFPLLCEYMANSTIMGNVSRELQEHESVLTPRLSACESLERILSAQSKTPDAVHSFFEYPTVLGTISAFLKIDEWRECVKRKIGIILMDNATSQCMLKNDFWGETVTAHYNQVESEFEKFCLAGQFIRKKQQLEARENTERQKRIARLIPAHEMTTMSPEEVDARNRRYQRPGGILH